MRSLSAVVILLGLAGAQPALAGPYSPDPAFGGHGFVFGPGSGWADVVAMADGRVLAAGGAGNIEDPPHRIALARFQADGSLDTTFGGDGMVEIPFPSPIYSLATAVALQDDGKIVAAGTASVGFQNYIVVLRYLADGTLDAGFGTDGIVTDLDSDQFASDLVIQPDGKIVVVGWVGLNYDGIIVKRYLADGTPDASFGGDGSVTIEIGSSALAVDGALQPDGRIVVVGSQFVPFMGTHGAVVRLLADGSLDPAFGVGGVVPTYAIPSSATAVALLPDGRIYVGGVAGSSSWLVIRYLADGSLDGTFGSGGIVTTPMTGTVYLEDIALQPDGRLVAAGHEFVSGVGFWPVVIRYLPDGTLDPSFGTVITLAGTDPGARQVFSAVAIAADGDIVAAGHSHDSSDDLDSLVVRYGTAFPVCWDGVVDAPEQCDDRNYVDGDCCSSTCQPEGAGTACTADIDPCTADVCDGAGLCTHGPGNDGAPCTDDIDPCTADVCDGGLCTHGPGNDGAPCTDGDVCTIDVCDAGLCTHEPGNDGAPCTDGDVCTTDACQGGSCVGLAEPQTSCKGPAPPSRGLFFVNADRENLKWNWLRGEATASFLQQEYKLCVYDQSAGPQPVTQLTTNCGSECWTQRGSQANYVDNSAAYDGISRIYFRAGPDGQARIKFQARGANLPMTPLPLVTPVTVQLHGLGNSQCWTASYGAPRRNDPSKFKAKPD